MSKNKLSEYVYFETENGVLYCGDSEEILKIIDIKEFDLLLTDPPYGIGTSSGTIGKTREHKHTYDTFEDSQEYIQTKVQAVIRDLISKSKATIITPGPKCLTCYPTPDSFGSINQPATVSMQKWGRADAQPIFYYGRDPLLGKTIQFCSYTLTEKADKNGHPCAKPLNIWTSLLKRGSINETDLIIDPFFGSGTTGLACEKLGRRWIGIEISKNYCEIAKKRIEEYTNQMKLF